MGVPVPVEDVRGILEEQREWEKKWHQKSQKDYIRAWYGVLWHGQFIQHFFFECSTQKSAEENQACEGEAVHVSSR